ncbi:MAG: acyltransferase [Lachnospiraceae bacterium]|nr:acyltransferase [Lachnospiraceae bacterium]
MKKKHYYELDFIRAVCALIVVCYHFTCACDIFELQGFRNIFYLYPNGKWGEMAVSVFFMLSGAVIIYNYEGKRLKMAEFYKKRWLSLFPMFYVIWLTLYLREVILNGGNWFWNGEPELLLLSLFGMDGYFYYLRRNYYFIGEWFLGAIIFLYLLFPLLKKLFERFRWQTSAALLVAWAMIFLVDWFKIEPFRNLITCVCSFWIGMLLMEYRDLCRKYWYCFLAGAVVMFTWKITVNTTLTMNLTAVMVFVVLFRLGGLVMKSSLLKKCILSVSRNSYGLFLTHHVIIDNWVKTQRYGQIGLKKQLLWMAAVLILSYISAVLLRIVAEALQKGVSSVVKRSVQ